MIRLDNTILSQLLKSGLVVIMFCFFGSFAWADGLVTNTSGGGQPEILTTNQKPDPKDDKEEEDQCNADDNSGNRGKPVSLYDGSESFVRTDLVVNGLYPIKISRRYNSQSTYDSNLGYGWSLAHDRRLYEFPDGSVIIRYGCGSRDRFVFTGGAYVTPDNGRQGDLLENPDGSFIYTRRFGTKEYYDAQGRLTAVQNKYGHRHEYTYDPAGKLPLTGTSPFSIDPTAPMTVAYTYQLTRIDERAADGVLTGNYVAIAYDTNTGRMGSVTSSDGRTISYVHDETAELTQGNLVQVNGLEGIVSTYAYDDPDDSHNITSVTNETGETPYVNTYDSLDRVIQQVHGNDTKIFDYVLDLTESTITHTITDATGLNPYNVKTTYFFDIEGNVEKMRDADGNELEYQRDIQGNLSNKKFFENQGTVTVPNLVLQKTIVFGYDALGRNSSETVTLDSGETITSSTTYDNGWVASTQVVSDANPSKIFRTEYTFNKDGNNVPINIASIKRRKDDGSFQTTSLGYDTKNRLTSTTLPDGQKIINLYEAGSLYVTKKYYEIAAAESPYGRVQYGYDSQGNRNQVTDANSNLTQTNYDDLGRAEKITNARNEEIIFTYVGSHLTQVESGRTVAEGEGQVLRMNYTAQGWLESVDEKVDASNWQLGVESYTYNSAGKTLTRSDALNRTTTFAYDDFGRIASVSDPLGKVTSFGYDFMGRRTSVIDANTIEIQTSYDDLDRAIQVKELGVSPNPVTLFSYDAADNLLTVTDPESNTTTYTYNALLQKTSEAKPLVQTLQYFYDNRNRLDYMLNARDQKIDYSYKTWGPVDLIEFYATPAAVIVERSIDQEYDFNGNLTTLSDSDSPVSPMYIKTYDVINREDVTTVKYIPGGDITVDSNYDRYGNRNSMVMIDSSGTYTHQYDYNKQNRLNTATLPGSQSFNNFSYFDNGNIQQLTFPSGITSDYNYETNGPIKDITITDGATQLEQLSYSYDNVKNVDTQTDSLGLHDYNYDNLNRLTQASHPLGSGLLAESFGYDKVGNREDPADATSYNYDNNNQISKSPTAASYIFDNDGNMISNASGETFSFNKLNRLTSYTKSAVTSSYLYDPLGRRINKTVIGDTTWYLWDNDKLIAEYNSSGSQNKRYAYLPDEYTPTQVAESGDIYDVHTDHLGTPRLLTDSVKNIVWQAQYESFGSINLVIDSIEFNFRFPGQYYDAENGRHYNYFRTYDPNTGRYITSDPIGLAGGINAYAYVRGNPLRYVDPFGLEKWDFDGYGNTKVCDYYDKRKNESCGDLSDYYDAAASICRGERIDVNSLFTIGIINAWVTDSTNSSMSEIFDQIRQDLINSDSELVEFYGDGNGITGTDIDNYHNDAFNSSGVGESFYGGNILPSDSIINHGGWLNPVPNY